jgi:hypothetical protein
MTRLLPSERANRAERERAHGGPPPVTLPLHYALARVVSPDMLHFAELAPADKRVEAGHVAQRG